MQISITNKLINIIIRQNFGIHKLRIDKMTAGYSDIKLRNSIQTRNYGDIKLIYSIMTRHYGENECTNQSISPFSPFLGFLVDDNKNSMTV